MIHQAVENTKLLFACGEEFYSQGALADCGKNGLGRKNLRNARGKSQAVEARLGEDDGVIAGGVELTEAGVHIAANFRHGEIGADGEKLRAAAQTPGTDARARRQRGEQLARAGDERVARSSR